ncbi:hypothetical protein PINS_up008158 [Pythium insidiosum]|nr:hypothetical protein PINS_up008158 [Pythium insidiosum]
MRHETLKHSIDEYVATKALGRSANAETLDRVMNTLMLTYSDREEDDMCLALRAYVQVAVARINDNVPMRLNARLLVVFLERLESQLMETTDEKLERLLEEPPHTQQRREELEKEVMTLRAAKEVTESFTDLKLKLSSWEREYANLIYADAGRNNTQTEIDGVTSFRWQ